MSPSLRQQKISSLRKKDAMWIYKNPQGLQILENELNERRKKRIARQKASTRSSSNDLVSPMKEQCTIPIAKTLPLDNQSLEDTEHKRQASKIEESKKLIELQKDPKRKEQGLKVLLEKAAADTPPIAPPRRSFPAKVVPLERAGSPQRNILLEARQKLLSAQQKTDNHITNSDTNMIKKKGLVSSFISAFEAPTPDSSDKNNTIKPLSKIESSKSVYSRSISSTEESSKSQKQMRTPSPTNVSEAPTFISDSYFTLSPSHISEMLPPRLCTSPDSMSSTSSKDETQTIDGNESTISVYLPQLSPEISVHGNHVQEESLEELRPGFKKQVSFSEHLLTYIPEEFDDSNSIVSSSCSSEITTPVSMTSQPAIKPETVSKFGQTISDELGGIKKNLVEKVSREKFVPPQFNKKESFVNKRSNMAPQKLSTKLLDMFQQKVSISTSPKLSRSSTEPTRELVHLTKTRPRKPPSLKKPTYPAATAQPDWRNKATTKKYEF
ncbi:uncharacterized protein B0P05DRAFT_594618, partial [Gilbertella persicaria]|uniref:uncharacterized protein n=1 Tax=Gilbertella persicaria TaxID=101096 RepID=UPI0022210DA0